MGYRLSWLAGIAGIVFALARLNRLLRPSLEGLPWQTILLAAAVLGALITWVAVSYRLRARWVLAANLVGASLALVRIAAPESTYFVFPTAASLAALGDELAVAREVIRSGVAPVIPLAGIIAILAAVFWALGAILTWGLLSGRPYTAVLAPLVVYLEFAIMDRLQSPGWALALMLIIGFALLAVALDQRRASTGLLLSRTTRKTLARSFPSLGAAVLASVVVMAMVTADALAGLVPRSGHLTWRATSGLSGQFHGSVAFNPFVSIRQSLISPSNVPVFTARVEGTVDDRALLWRLVTLDAFDGTQWHIGPGAVLGVPEDRRTFEDPAYAFGGRTDRVRTTVTIAALQMDWLPAAYAPVAFTSPDATLERGIRAKFDDASLRFDALTFRGLTYTVDSDVPRPDLGVLSRTPDGFPSIVFANAAAAGRFDIPPLEGPIEQRSLPDTERFLDLPGDLDPAIGALAREQTRNLQTDYERALALEAFFRAPGAFRYTTDIEPGHGAEDLSAWLLDPDSSNYRAGYCEQFATAMAVMARTLGIPSRVVLGFTPGTRADDGAIVVRDRNAHAWVELWMPSQGWVQFDPTPRVDGVNPSTLSLVPFGIGAFLDVPALPVVPGEPPPPTGPADDLPFELDEEPFDPRRDPALDERGIGDPVRILGLVAGALLVATIVGAVPAFKWHRRRRRLGRLREGDVTAAWKEIVDRLVDLGERPSRAATPMEFADRISPALVPLASVYTEATYGPSAAPSPERLALAARSLADTEHQLTGRYSVRRRIAGRYRLASVWRRKRRAGSSVRR